MAEDGASSESSRPTNGATEGQEGEEASRGSTGATTWPDEEEDGGSGAGSAGETSAQGLRQELARAQKERDDFEAQYKGLLGKLTQMRSTLGERLRQDAVSRPPQMSQARNASVGSPAHAIDRRPQEELEAKDAQIESLSAETETLTSTVESLKEELVQSNAEAEKLTAELGALKQSSKSSSSDERSSREQIAALENRVRELLDSSESLRLDVESMESSLQSERAAREEAEESGYGAQRLRGAMQSSGPSSNETSQREKGRQRASCSRYWRSSRRAKTASYNERSATTRKSTTGPRWRTRKKRRRRARHHGNWKSSARRRRDVKGSKARSRRRTCSSESCGTKVRS